MFVLSRGGDCETIEQYVLHSLLNAVSKLRKRIGIDKEMGEKMKMVCRGIILNIKKKAEERLCKQHGLLFCTYCRQQFLFHLILPNK